MKKISILLSVLLSLSLAYPVSARGGFGGFSGGGHSFGGFSGGGHSFSDFGGGGRSFSGFGGGGHSFADSGRSLGGGFGGHSSSSNFGGGFNSAGGQHFGSGLSGDSGFRNSGNFTNRPSGGGFNNRPNDGGFNNRPGGGGSGEWGDHGGWNKGNGNWGGNHPDQPISTRPVNGNGHFSTDNGWGHASNFSNNSANFNHFSQNNFQSTNVRNSFNHYNQYNFNHWGGYGYHGGWGGYGYHGGWWGYPGGWCCPGWSSATAWTFMGLSSLTAFLGVAAIAGSGGGHSKNTDNNNSVTNVSYNGGNVYINGTSAGSEQDYYLQAQNLAAQGTQYAASTEQSPTSTTSADQWQALGVFSLVQPGQQESSMLLQLAVNRDGILRGNYFNQLTNETSEVYGSLNKQTQRVSFTLGQNNGTVFDTSLADLAKDDAPVLVHYGPTNTQSMMMLRVKQPKQSKQQQEQQQQQQQPDQSQDQSDQTAPF